MGYNKNNKAAQSIGNASHRHKHTVWLVAAVGVLLAAIIAVCTTFKLNSGDDDVPLDRMAISNRSSKANSRVTGQKVQQSTKQEPRTNELSEAWQKYYDGRDTNQWIVVKDPKTGKEHLSRLMRPGSKNRKPPLYKAHALNALHAILFKDPSTPLPGIRIDDRFVQSFQDALVEKIEILDSDSEADKESKREMIATIDFLKQEIKNGGDLKSIVGEALLERQRISALYHLMIQERVKMRNEGASEEEISDFEEICNRKLAEKGAPPLLNKKTILERLEQKLNSEGMNR